METKQDVRGEPTDIREQADRLFLHGWEAERLDDETLLLYGPQGRRYRINTLFQTCTCQDTTIAMGRGPCAHLLGYARLLSDQKAYDEAQFAALEAQYDAWDMTIENDRTERLLREMGVCEF